MSIASRPCYSASHSRPLVTSVTPARPTGVAGCKPPPHAGGNTEMTTSGRGGEKKGRQPLCNCTGSLCLLICYVLASAPAALLAGAKRRGWGARRGRGWGRGRGEGRGPVQVSRNFPYRRSLIPQNEATLVPSTVAGGGGGGGEWGGGEAWEGEEVEEVEAPEGRSIKNVSLPSL